ncbi:hypothetical protein PoB_006244900 [Plakobranchus ocellatus]|uniref:Uncharacterized protein n=1 Tax=Plakobranchus ocellatus TaxID=259542 RepID=A0AAV4CVM2_9GAST|nr:hypothetical protein PoB_006244900 [Plakobranchus ocellatus]
MVVVVVMIEEEEEEDEEEEKGEKEVEMEELEEEEEEEELGSFSTNCFLHFYHSKATQSHIQQGILLRVSCHQCPGVTAS